MVLFAYENNTKLDVVCGGSLISHYFVLTTAHCNENFNENLLALLGTFNSFHTDAMHVQIRGIKENHLHKDFDGLTHYNDIQLVKLNESITFNEYIMPVCLPSPELDIGTIFIASGWGSTYSSEYASSDKLLKVVINEVPSIRCKNKKYFSKNIQICAGSETTLKDTCEGDSGIKLVFFY